MQLLFNKNKNIACRKLKVKVMLLTFSIKYFFTFYVSFVLYDLFKSNFLSIYFNLSHD